ncbi:MAG: DUF3124 domain-containing protein [Planctomycetales bacterium]|nr:DUF3124 domain-containing protein [Planctomycetales bacterium]
MVRRMTVDDVDAFMRQLKWLIAGAIALFMVPLAIYAVYLERRLDAFEQTLQHSPPEELQADDVVRRDLYHLTANPVEGQVVYVPAYSHVYHGEGKPYLLTITLSVRNTSMESDIVVKSVRYFDTKGKEVKSYLAKPVLLPALGTTEVLIDREDASGGSGANFLVEWYANQPVTEPIIEAVMIDTSSQQGISFARRGSVISEVKSYSSGDQVESPIALQDKSE